MDLLAKRCEGEAIISILKLIGFRQSWEDIAWAEINKNYKLWTRAFLEKMNTNIVIFPISEKIIIIFLGNQ